MSSSRGLGAVTCTSPGEGNAWTWLGGDETDDQGARLGWCPDILSTMPDVPVNRLDGVSGPVPRFGGQDLPVRRSSAPKHPTGSLRCARSDRSSAPEPTAHDRRVHGVHLCDG